MVEALTEPMLTQEGLVLPLAGALLQLFVGSFDLTRLCLYCSHRNASTHYSTFAASHFYSVCFRGSH